MMNSDVNLDRASTGPTGRTAPRPAAWLDAGAEAGRRAVRQLSSWSETGVRYFRERRPEDIAADVTALARERPGQTLAAAAILGALVGSALYRFGRR